ncbi:MAG: hypothetical protein IM610_15020 [Cytophagales bacterium]|nr:hypothetical protein [Cytophagales bacterium]
MNLQLWRKHVTNRITKTLIISGLLAASSAQAGSLNLDLRFDYTSTAYNDVGKNSSTNPLPDNERWYAQTAKLDFQNKMSDELDYRVRLNFPSAAVASGTSNQRRDGLNSFVEFLYATHKMGNLSFTVGKFASEIGGWEGNTTTADQYTYSEAFDDNFTNLKTTNSATALGNRVLRYYAGGRLGYKTEFGDFSFHAANNRSDLTDSSTPQSDLRQTQGWMAAVYKGSFAEKMFQPLLSYHKVSEGKDADYTYMAAGLRTVIDATTVDLDYLQNTWDGTGTDKDTLTSISVAVAHKINDQYAARLKTASSDKKDEGGASELKHKAMTYGLGLEYKPMADQNFRYHLGYAMTEWKPDGADKITRTEMTFGIRMLHDFLK